MAWRQLPRALKHKIKWMVMEMLPKELGKGLFEISDAVNRGSVDSID